MPSSSSTLQHDNSVRIDLCFVNLPFHRCCLLVIAHYREYKQHFYYSFNFMIHKCTDFSLYIVLALCRLTTLIFWNWKCLVHFFLYFIRQSFWIFFSSHLKQNAGVGKQKNPFSMFAFSSFCLDLIEFSLYLHTIFSVVDSKEVEEEKFLMSCYLLIAIIIISWYYEVY